jgi:hypothetical protein
MFLRSSLLQVMQRFFEANLVEVLPKRDAQISVEERGGIGRAQGGRNIWRASSTASSITNGHERGAELLFRLVSERYEHGSIILTSNKFFSDWGELLCDTVIATALLDRLLHHSHVNNIRGQTYRLKDRL